MTKRTDYLVTKCGNGTKTHYALLHTYSRFHTGPEEVIYDAVCGASGAGGGNTTKALNMGTSAVMNSDEEVTCKRCQKYMSVLSTCETCGEVYYQEKRCPCK